ncbi:MAG: ABC transporter ATP-binding protein [Muribaculaceae bacterium]|nr:ABC transporter ATP-binding protein [Muribaculaceae bacterium]
MKEFLQILRRFVPPYKKYLILNIFFNIISAFLTLFSFALIIPILRMLFKVDNAHYDFIPWGTEGLKEELVNNGYYYIQEAIEMWGQSTALALLALGLVIMTMLKTGTYYLAAYYLIPIRSGIVRDIRNYVYDKILALPVSFFTAERKGDVMARMSGDVSEIENSIMASLDMMFKNPIIIISCLVMMFVVSWQLTVFVLILLPIAGWFMGAVGKRLKRVGFEGQTQWGVLLANIEETLGGLRIIKAFNAEPKVRKRFYEENQKFYKISNRLNRRYSLAHPMSEFLGTITIAIVLWFGGTLIFSGNSTIDASQFIYYMIIFYNIINPAKDLSKAVYSIQKGLASMQRVEVILKADNPIKDPVNPKPVDTSKCAIEYKDVKFSYTDRPVINGVSLSIPHGSTVALVGQSGSGKSTLADLLPRFYDVNEGQILINGNDIRDYKVHDLRQLMGNVNQEAILFNDTFYNLSRIHIVLCRRLNWCRYLWAPYH